MYSQRLLPLDLWYTWSCYPLLFPRFIRWSVQYWRRHSSLPLPPATHHTTITTCGKDLPGEAGRILQDLSSSCASSPHHHTGQCFPPAPPDTSTAGYQHSEGVQILLHLLPRVVGRPGLLAGLHCLSSSQGWSGVCISLQSSLTTFADHLLSSHHHLHCLCLWQVGTLSH